MRISDLLGLGFLPLRHGEEKVDLGLRNTLYACAIADANALPHESTLDRSIGDVVGATLWRSERKDKRPLHGWAFGWSAQVDVPADDPGSRASRAAGSGGAGGGGGAGGRGGGDRAHGGFGGPPDRQVGGQSGGGGTYNPFGGVLGNTAGRGQLGQLGHSGGDPFGGVIGNTAGRGSLGQINVGGRPASDRFGGIFGAHSDGSSLGQLLVTKGNGARPGSSSPASAPARSDGRDGGGGGSGKAGPGAGGAGVNGGRGGAGGSGGGSGGGGGGGGMTESRQEAEAGFEPSLFRPTQTGDLDADTRFEPKTAAFPRWASRFPEGWPGVIMAAVNEDSQEEVFHPDAMALVAPRDDANPDLGTAVVDLDARGRVDPERRAQVNDFWRVVKAPDGVLRNALSWDIRRSFVTDAADPNGDGLTTQTRDDAAAAPKVAHGRPHAVFDVGERGCSHTASADADGNAIRPLHIRTAAPFLWPNVGDGPLFFEAGGRPVTRGGPERIPVHLSFDPAIGAAGQTNTGNGVAEGGRGAWAWWAETVFGSDDDPPETPPLDPGGGDDGEGGGGGNPPWGPDGPSEGGFWKPNRTKGGWHLPPRPPGGWKGFRPPLFVSATRLMEDFSRPIGSTSLETAVPSLLIQPHTFGCGERDIRNEASPPRDLHERHRSRHPVIARIEGAWKKIGASCNPCEPAYTYMPGRARYRGGTAPGILGFLPPEVGMEDYASSFAPGGITLSTLYLCALRGSVRWGSGIPNPTTGLIESGNHWGSASGSAAMTFVSTTAAGVDDKTRTLPNRTGSILLAPATGTQNYLPRWDANGDLVDSAAIDDGSLITLGRATIQAGSSTDVTVKATDGNTARAVTVRGSDAASGNSTGGASYIRGGTSAGSGTGGAASLAGGAATSTGAGGSASVVGGDGAGNGGAASLTGGASTINTGGSASVVGGASTSGAGGAGAASLTGGAGGTGGAAGGPVTVAGGTATSTAGGAAAGAATVRGGDAGGAGNNDGGALTLRAGLKANSGTNGVLDIQHADGTTRWKIDASGNTLYGGTQGTSGTLARFGATGLPVDAGITDDGSTITLGRDTTVTAGKKLTATGSETEAGLNIGQLGGAPSSPNSGDLWGEASDPHPHYYGNTAEQIVEVQSKKDVASGYCGLDSNARVTSTKLQMSATDKIVGRQSPNAGASEEIACTASGRDFIALNVVQGDLAIGHGTGDWAILAKPSAPSFLSHDGGSTDPAWFLNIAKTKTVDESVASTTTLQDDNHLASFSLAASTAYIVEISLFFAQTSGVNIKYQIVDSGSVTTWGESYYVLYENATANIGGPFTSSASHTVSRATTAEARLYIHAYILTNAAGTLKLQWAQGTSSGTNLTVRAGSYMRVRKAN